MTRTAENGKTYGAGYVMWRLANADKPLTSKEIASDIPIQCGSVDKSLLNCWRRGWLVRRPRKTHGRGKDPYEYAIAERES